MHETVLIRTASPPACVVVWWGSTRERGQD